MYVRLGNQMSWSLKEREAKRRWSAVAGEIPRNTRKFLIKHIGWPSLLARPRGKRERANQQRTHKSVGFGLKVLLLHLAGPHSDSQGIILLSSSETVTAEYCWGAKPVWEIKKGCGETV